MYLSAVGTQKRKIISGFQKSKKILDFPGRVVNKLEPCEIV